MAITLKDFQAFAEARMSEAISPDLVPAKFKEIMDFGFANEASMDAEAKAHFDNLLKISQTRLRLDYAMCRIARSREGCSAQSREQDKSITGQRICLRGSVCRTLSRVR